MTDILQLLKKLEEEQSSEIEQWFSQQRGAGHPFIYSSVDLRHSGYKLAPVDTNLYPAGFNNLSPAARVRASRFLQQFLEERHGSAKKVLIIPENHTRNLSYLENLATLMTLFENAGAEVQLGSLAALTGEPIVLVSPSGRELIEHPLKRDGATLKLENGFTPDVVVLNNDMTAGSPEILAGITQPLLPPPGMGWHRRRKSVHFAEYRALVDDFCACFKLDPWLLSAEFYQCGFIEFKERTGLDALAKGIEKVLTKVKEKYAEYGIKDEPYVFVKADSGTYGMGIMTIRSPEEVFEMNKKERNKMQVIKEGTQVSEVIIQEGVPTLDLVQGKPAEPMIYLIDGIPVGGMFRFNGERDAYGNLNASGMEFTGMCDEMESLADPWKKIDACNFRSFGILAAIAALACAREDYDSVNPAKIANG